MKTHVLKNVLMPMVALFMAVSLAFASNSVESTDNTTDVPGYIFQDEICRLVTTCQSNGIADCTYFQETVLSKVNETSCGFPLKYTP